MQTGCFFWEAFGLQFKSSAHILDSGEECIFYFGKLSLNLLGKWNLGKSVNRYFAKLRTLCFLSGRICLF